MKIFFTAIVSFLLLMTTVEAAKIDAYRNIISSERFTLKYKIVEPPIRVTNKEAKLKGSGFFGNFEMMDTSALQLQHSNNFQNIIVHDGANSYMEKPVSITVKVLHNAGLLVGVKSKSIQNPIVCVLKKNGENFRFTYSQKDDKKTYYGNYGSTGVYANLL